MRRKIGDMYKYGFYWEARVHLGCTSWRVLAVREKTTPSAPYRKIRDAPVQKAHCGTNPKGPAVGALPSVARR